MESRLFFDELLDRLTPQDQCPQLSDAVSLDYDAREFLPARDSARVVYVVDRVLTAADNNQVKFERLTEWSLLYRLTGFGYNCKAGSDELIQFLMNAAEQLGVPRMDARYYKFGLALLQQLNSRITIV
jgi:hypothetical protein